MSKRILLREELHLVRPKFRPIVEAAWLAGKDVPYGIIYLSDRMLTRAEEEYGRTLTPSVTP